MEEFLIREDDCIIPRINELNRKRDEIIRYEARNILKYMKTLEENVGKTLIIRCLPITWPLQEKHPSTIYIVGRIGNPPFSLNNEGQLLAEAEDNVFVIDYDLNKKDGRATKDRYKEDIKNENILARFIGQFPIHLWELVQPREFEYDKERIHIQNIQISDSDFLLKYLERYKINL